MFLKPFSTKSKAVIKGSECKKLRCKLLSQYNNIDASILEIILPLKSEIILAKLLLHNGNVSNVYILQNQPLIFTYDDMFYFTVYSLWKCMALVPYLTTWPAVFEKLSKGADLMLPGVILNESSTEFISNQPCAVRLKGNSYAVSVGTLAISSEDIKDHKVEKGKIVFILHSYRDLLWSLGDKSELPYSNDESNDVIEQIVKTGCNHDAISPVDLNTDMNSLKLDSQLINDVTQNDDSDVLHFSNISNDLTNVCDVTDKKTEKALKFDSMDDLLDQILLYTLKKEKNKLALPILTSTFYRNYIITNCPKGNYVDIKQTSFKKLSKFLLAKQNDGLLQVAELSKGADSIISLNYQHQKVLKFPFKNWELNETEDDSLEVSSKIEFHPPEINEVFIVSAKVLEFFKLLSKKKGDSFTAQEIREIITEYVKSNSLQEGSGVKLDAMLTDIVVNKNECIEVIDWPILMQRFLHQMNEGFYISLNKQAPILHKGSVPKIILDVEQRASNKKVTTIQNLKQFEIDEERFAQTIQRLVSGSASLITDKSNIRKVIVQGNQIHYIKTLLLDTYQIPLKYIVGLDKAIKTKK